MDFIDWTCDTCHNTTNGSGAIHIAYADIHRAEADRKTWADRPGSNTFMDWNPADALIQPLLALWKVECDTCAGACEGSYWVDLRQARTVADLARWTEHLALKGWFTATNWTALVASIEATQQTRSTV